MRGHETHKTVGVLANDVHDGMSYCVDCGVVEARLKVAPGHVVVDMNALSQGLVEAIQGIGSSLVNAFREHHEKTHTDPASVYYEGGVPCPFCAGTLK